MDPTTYNPTAAVIVIGDEILSGRVVDSNTNFIANKLRSEGIKLVEVRIIGDDVKQISETINSLKIRYDYIFTTGGIGPTHDDVTTKAISNALGVPLELNMDVLKLLTDFYISQGIEINESRKKMSYFPVGSKLIKNSISIAPGFSIENIFVLAGISNVMKVMVEEVLANIKKGKPVKSKSIDLLIAEGDIAADFEKLQLSFPNVEMGSYPFKMGNTYGTSLVLSSSDYVMLDLAYNELVKIFNKITKHIL